MSWLNDLKQQSYPGYVDIKHPNFENSYKNVREAHAYCIDQVIMPKETVLPAYYAAFPGAEKTAIVDGITLLDSFSALVVAYDNQTEDVLLYGDNKDAPSSYWKVKIEEYDRQVKSFARLVSQLSLPIEKKRLTPEESLDIP